MSVEIEWTIEVGDSTAAHTDFTGRTTGLAITQLLDISRHRTQQAVITLENYDGALTPGAGGTYSSLNWFAQAVFISASVNGGTAVPVFHGILDDFRLVDDGVDSTVTLTCVDWMTVCGRAFRDSVITATWQQTFAVYYDMRSLALGIGTDSQALPALGGSITDVQATVFEGGYGPMLDYSWSQGFVADYVFNSLMTSGLCVIYPTTITAAGSQAYYYATLIGDHLTRTTTGHTFALSESNGSATEIPVTAVRSGYSIDRLVNDATMERDGGTAQRSTDTTSIEQYGQRSILFSGLANQTDAGAASVAANWVNRFAGVDFIPRQVNIESGALTASPSGLASEIEDLLSVNTGLWQTATLEYTPTGAASAVTANCVISGRTITAVPKRTTITLELLPAADYQSFTLDSDVLGVLDQNRLG